MSMHPPLLPSKASVVIIGAGPTGLTAANLLGQAGIETLVIERNKETCLFPRAVAIDDEGLRVFQACGLGEEILAHIRPNVKAHYISSQHFLAKIAPQEHRNGVPQLSTFHQPTLERILLKGLERFPCVTVYFEHTLVSFEQDEHRVHLSINTSDDHLCLLECVYLLACDGGKSLIRRHLAIPTHSLRRGRVDDAQQQKWLVVDAIDEGESSDTIFFLCNPTRPAVSVPGPGTQRRWEFMLLPGEREEDLLETETVTRLITQTMHAIQIPVDKGKQGRGSILHTPNTFNGHRRVGVGGGEERRGGLGLTLLGELFPTRVSHSPSRVSPRPPLLSSPPLTPTLPSRDAVIPPLSTSVQITRQAIYTFHALIAARFSQGRTFLLGDAAHLMPPFGGQGMNSGLRDAHNLCWKLQLVVQNSADITVLASYHQERYPHVTQMIQFSSFLGTVIMTTRRPIARLRDLFFRLINKVPPMREMLTEMRIKPQPRYTDGLLLKNSVRGTRKLVGAFFPQPYVLTQEGKRVLLDEVVGNGFSLFRLCDEFDGFSGLKHPVWEKLQVRIIAVKSSAYEEKSIGVPIDSVRSDWYSSVVDSERGISNFLNDRRDVYVLVRPDRYVMGVCLVRDILEFEKDLQNLLSAITNLPSYRI